MAQSQLRNMSSVENFPPGAGSSADFSGERALEANLVFVGPPSLNIDVFFPENIFHLWTGFQCCFLS